MKVLAERSNRIFIVGPIILVVLGSYIVYRLKRRHSGFYYRSGRTFAIAFTLFITTLCGIIERIFMPKVLIEYDNAGIYIYKYKGREPIIIRFESIWSFSTEIDYGSEDDSFEAYSYEHAALIGSTLTGSLKIQTANEIIKIRGIKNVKDVERKLDKLRDEYMELRNERYDAIIAQKRREEELAELAKHDPNT